MQHNPAFRRTHYLLLAIAMCLNLFVLNPAAVTYADDPRATTGAWAPVLDWGIFAKHMALLPTGKVLVWPSGQNARVWDPATQTSISTPALFGDLHCAGQTMLADGRVIVIGGQGDAIHDGIKVTGLFQPFTNTWTEGSPMAYPRWYATSTTLPDGRVLATSGDAPDGTRSNIPEIYDPEFIANERLCCPFFTFNLEVTPAQGPLWLRITGSEEIKSFLQRTNEQVSENEREG